MATPKVSSTRQTLEDSWRLRLEEAQARYHKATDWYRRLLQEQPDGMSHDPKGTLAIARQEESEARAAYSRILRAFTELTLYGRVPAERSVAVSDSL
jgi:hypothetical protein